MKKFPRPRKRILDQDKVSPFLKSIGFATESITQEWRHLTAFGTYLGHDAVFKLASTEKTGVLTHHEYSWNEIVHLSPLISRNSFTVPKNYSFGNFGKLFYFIAERFMSNPLGHLKTDLSNQVKLRIPQIARMTREIELLPIPSDSAFGLIQSSPSSVSTGQKLLDSASEWASQVPLNLTAFLNILENSKDLVKTAPVHGDFVLRQMYDVEERIGIIDGEHAKPYGAYHYDVAQMYIQLRFDYEAPDLARLYLLEYMSLLPFGEKKHFWEDLKYPLIQRFIGSLWDNCKNSERFDKLQLLGKDILEENVVELAVKSINM